jgi:hypothetical protein
MISATYVNKTKSNAIHVCNAKQRYIDEGVIVPAIIDKELNLLSAFEQCLYLTDDFDLATIGNLYKGIDDLIKYIHLGAVPIYTFRTQDYMKYMVTPPADKAELYRELLEGIANAGVEVLNDCNAGCSETNRTPYSLYNVFIAATSALDVGQATTANVLFQYIDHKLHQTI